MEKVLDVYKRPYNQKFPVICMDESPRQLIGEVKMPIPGAAGRPARYDYEYKRHGVCNVFMSNEPFESPRLYRRHKSLRGLCYEKTSEVFTGSP